MAIIAGSTGQILYVMYHDIYHVIMVARAYKNAGHGIKIIENLWNSVFLFLKCIFYLMEPHYRNDEKVTNNKKKFSNKLKSLYDIYDI